MEPSQSFAGAEECHSSESGWTMYIGSPIHGDDDDGDDHSDDGDEDDDDDDDDDDDSDDGDVNHDDDSDDSMASDASSGPSNRDGMAHYKHREEKDEGKHWSQKKKAKNPVEKKIYGKRKGEKEESVFTATRANVSIQSSGKVKKNSCMAKRK